MKSPTKVLPLLIAVILSGGLSRYAAAQPPVPQTNGASFSTTLGPYEYDADGNIVVIEGATPMDFAYDGLGRLHTAKVTVPGRTAITQTYEYDEFGNRKSATGAGSVCVGQLNCDQPATAFGIDVTTNHLTTGTGGAVAYNRRGGVTRFGTTSFTYTPDDAVATEERPTETRYYLYTASGERVAVYTVPTDARPKMWEWSLRDESGKVLSRYTSSDDPQASVPGTANLTLTEDLVYRDGLMFVSKSGTAVNYFHLDHLGTPRLITSAAGGKVGEHAYLPFGPELEWPGRINESPEEAAKFTGHDRDSRADAGMLDYMHARYYGGVVGRFLSVDPKNQREPLSLAQGWNRYSYAQNNALKYVDPDGEETKLAVGLRTERNPAGHVAIIINDQVYSFGTNYSRRAVTQQDWGASAQTYLDEQADRRQTELLTLKVTPEQEHKLQQYLDANNPNAAGAPTYSKLSNSCATVTQNALVNTATMPAVVMGPITPRGSGPVSTAPAILPGRVGANATNSGIVARTETVGTEPKVSWFRTIINAVQDLRR